MWTHNKLPEISTIPLPVGMTGIPEVLSTGSSGGILSVLESHHSAHSIRHKTHRLSPPKHQLPVLAFGRGCCDRVCGAGGAGGCACDCSTHASPGLDGSSSAFLLLKQTCTHISPLLAWNGSALKTSLLMRPLFEPVTTRPADSLQHRRSPTPVDFPTSPGLAPRLNPQRWSRNPRGRRSMMTERPPPHPWAHPPLTAPGPHRPRRVHPAASAPPTPPGMHLIGAQPLPPLDGQLPRPTAGGLAGACAARGWGRAEGVRMAGDEALRGGGCGLEDVGCKGRLARQGRTRGGWGRLAR